MEPVEVRNQNALSDTGELVSRIKALKKERTATVLVHYYQHADNYQVADHVGDSLELARRAANSSADEIVCAGVRFMAETAKILCPDRKVLLPVNHAGCELVDSITPNDVRQLRQEHPGVPVIAYVNTSADVKALADVCCTSRNALEIIRKVASDTVIFLPDSNMADFLRRQSGKRIISWSGDCYVHRKITLSRTLRARATHPDSVFMAHPECAPEVLELADVVCSTKGMFDYAQSSPAAKFLVGTEIGVTLALRQLHPAKQFFSLGNICQNMKKTRLKHILNALERGVYEIRIPPEVISRARASLDKMFEIMSA